MKLLQTALIGFAIALLTGSFASPPRPKGAQDFKDLQPRSQNPLPLPISRSQSVSSVPQKLAQQPTPASNEVGQEIVKQLTECVVSQLQNPQQPNLEAIQAVSMQCVVKVVFLTPDGKVRPDANQRMMALMKTTGLTVPQSSSQGQASVKLQPVTNSKLFTVPVTVGGQQKTFLLDTGASNSIVDTQITQELGLTGTPIPNDILAYFVVGNDCSQVNATMHSLPPLAVDAAKVEGLNGMGLPKTAIPRSAAGVLGLDFLKGFDVLVDPKALQLQLMPPSSSVTGAVPLVGKLGVMTTQVKINGQGPFTFLLDTGADLMVVSQRLASSLSLDVAKGKEVEVQGFCGTEKGHQIQLDRVNLQQHEVTQLDTVILDNQTLDLLGVEGIIGQNFLTRYRQHWRFDKPNELGFPETGSLVLTPIGN